MAIRFGICKDFDKLELVAKAGFDYIEPQFRTLTAMSEEDFQKVKAQIKELNIKCETFNLFAPHDTPSLRCEDIDIEPFKGFVRMGMDRAKQLGGEIVVIGCGWLRKVPEGMTYEHALDETAKTFRIVADIAAEFDIKIVAEPLNTTETNFINTIKDGNDFVKYCNHPSIMGLVDFYHTFRNNEDLDEIEANMDSVIHTHLARPNNDRGCPKEEDIPMLEKWAKILKNSGYNGRLSMECGTKQGLDEDKEIALGLEILKRVFG